MRDATDAPALRAVVLTGAGSVFCSGADLSERGTAAPNRMPEILTGIVESPVPVIARVNGHAARRRHRAHCRRATWPWPPRRRTFAFTEVRVGVAPAMILVPALRVMERRFLARMVLTGERFDAREAAAAGLLSAVVEDEPALDAWVAARRPTPCEAAPRARSLPPRSCCGPCRRGRGPRPWRPRPDVGGACSRGPRRPRGWRPSSRSAGRRGTRGP